MSPSHAAVRDEYAGSYRELYERHWWWRAREAMILQALAELPLRPGAERILDVGCADGVAFGVLSQFGTVEGIEPIAPISPERRDRIFRGPLEDFRSPHRFSLILMLDVLEHLDDPVVGLRHVLSLLEPGGLVVITVPAFMQLWTAHDDVNDHRVRFTRDSFAAVAADAGLRVQSSRYHFHWTYPIKRAQHLLERFTPARPNASRIPPALVNGLLLSLTRAERRLLGPLNLPFGSSLLAIGTHPT